MGSFSYQGISDRVARGYLAKHGNVTWADIEGSLRRTTPCPKLGSYWSYSGCRYDKGSSTCGEPEHVAACPVPLHKLRNGRLNQTAYSFFLFVRDIAQNDLVGWIQARLSAPRQAGHVTRANETIARQERLIGALRHIYGVSDKILTMSLSGLLIGAPNRYRLWHETGYGMIAVDTLVHNFLHRTGILHGCGKPHVYGPACYAENGCASIIQSVSAKIDASTFGREFPKTFPRFVQHALWRFCAADGLNVCNGNRIDDLLGCENRFCQAGRNCRRNRLKT